MWNLKNIVIAVATGVVGNGNGMVADALKILSSAPSGEITYSLGNLTFYAPVKPVITACLSTDLTEILPLTVFQTNATHITADTLRELMDTYLDFDDVWNEEFLTGAVAFSGTPSTTWDETAVSWMQESGTRYILSVNGSYPTSSDSPLRVLQVPSAHFLPPGPYLASIRPTKIEISQAYRLYRDKNEAFLFGVTSTPGSSAYTPAEAFVPSYQDVWIPVPSRLYYLHDQRELAGIRVGLKDIYDLEGVQTGGGSRSYAEVFPVANETAVPIQKLLHLGAVIIVSVVQVDCKVLYLRIAGKNKDQPIRARG